MATTTTTTAPATTTTVNLAAEKAASKARKAQGKGTQAPTTQGAPAPAAPTTPQPAPGFNMAPPVVFTKGQAAGTNKWAFVMQPCCLADGTALNRTVYSRTVNGAPRYHIVVKGTEYVVVLNNAGVWQVTGRLPKGR